MKKRLLFVAVPAFLVACSQKANQAPSETTGSASTQQAASYTPRIGIGVQTGSRTCIAIQNSTLQPGTAVTLISPLVPQSFVQAQVTGSSSNTCPVSKEINAALSSYDVKAEVNPQKLVPLIAVVSSASAFSTGNNNVQADLDQNGKTEVFRACGAADGYHLTAWGGSPLTGTLIWHGYYYEPDNPGTAPACTPKETTGP